MRKCLLFLSLLLLVFCACHKKESPALRIKTQDYQKAKSFLYHQNDSAFYYFNKFIAGAKDSLLIAKAYNNMAAIQSDAGDYFGSQESLSMSLRFLDEQQDKDRKCLASDYNELGMSSQKLGNYEAALTFFDKAIRFTNSDELKATLLNNKAFTYQQKAAYAQALTIYRQTIAQTKGDTTTYARILTNMATTKWLQQPEYNAAPELLKALRLRQEDNDLWGENSSYGHLCDYYSFSQPDSALAYARKMYAVTLRLNSPDDELEALKRLIKVGPPTAAKGYFIRYQQLNDSVQTARNAAKNQFALIRYDVEKNKADNLKLQKDITDEHYQVIQRNVWLACALFILIAGTITAIIWYGKRRRRLELEARNTIQASKLKTSQKVHDVVANGLYRLIAELQHRELIDKDHLLYQMDELYERSRDISYEEVQTPESYFHEKISNLVSSFASATVRVAVTGNSESLWLNVSAAARQELEHIIQELLINMKKHSKASTVAVKFLRTDSWISIYYTDNGIGLSKKVQFKNGLTNTGNRINNIRGTITFDTDTEKGLHIKIAFPVH